jgi:16S rRNA (guanine527-N7)-methyltransferase
MNFKELVFKYTNYELTDDQIDQFEIYYNFLVEYNKKVNLTRITEKLMFILNIFLIQFYQSNNLILPKLTQ